MSLSRLLQRYPIPAQAATAGILFGVGDVVAQKLFHAEEEEDEDKGETKSKPTTPWNWQRTLRMSAFGCFVAGPSIFLWYRFLEQRVRLASPTATLFARVGMDQFLFSPVSISVFITSTQLMNGRSWLDVRRKLESDYFQALRSNYMLWPWVQLVNFYAVPLNYRAPVVNTIAIGWNSYMSWLSHRK